MSQVILQPAGGREPREHYAQTIEKPVAQEHLARFLARADVATLRSLYGARAIPTWGIVPDSKGQRVEWDRIRPGDLVFFTGGKRAYASGIVTHKTRNRRLAESLWGTDSDGRTWEFIYFLDNVVPVSVPYIELNKAIGNSPGDNHQRMTVLDPNRSDLLLQLPQLSSVLHPEPEVAEAEREIAQAAGKPGPRQGWRIPAEIRQAIELHAMHVAEAHLRKLGWTVEDVSKRRSYDFHCTKVGEELRVEVKGTTSTGNEVILTPGEVGHARTQYPNVALFVVANIMLSGENKPSGGDRRLVTPWKVEDASLRPLGFSHTVPNE